MLKCGLWSVFKPIFITSQFSEVIDLHVPTEPMVLEPNRATLSNSEKEECSTTTYSNVVERQKKEGKWQYVKSIKKEKRKRREKRKRKEEKQKEKKEKNGKRDGLRGEV